jgi:hypothetical protein
VRERPFVRFSFAAVIRLIAIALSFRFLMLS